MISMEIVEDGSIGPSETVTMNQSELALKYHISRNSVITKLEAAEIHPIKKGGPGGTRYEVTPELEEALELDYIKSDRKTAATERKLEAEAELKELEVKKRLGEYVPLMDVELAAVNLFRSLYLRIVKYCDDSALELSRMTTRGEVAAHQKQELGAILQELRSNPNNYITANLESDI